MPSSYGGAVPAGSAAGTALCGFRSRVHQQHDPEHARNDRELLCVSWPERRSAALWPESGPTPAVRAGPPRQAGRAGRRHPGGCSVHRAGQPLAQRPGNPRGYPRVSYWREEVAMCSGDRLLADFVAGTDVRPGLPGKLEEHLTTTVTGLWVVWAHKLAWLVGDRFLPLTGGPGYPADATAQCRFRGAHDAPDPGCTCGFHALSSRSLLGLPIRRGCTVLTVALSGRVLAYEWADQGVLWRAERQTVVRIEQQAVDRIEWPARSDRTAAV